MSATRLPVKHDWTADMWDWPLQSHEGSAKVKNDESGFEVNLEVPYFTPNEIEVKLLGDELVIHCAHQARTDEFGSISREVHRCYRLPPEVEPASMKSYLSQRGVLTISASKKKT